MNKFRCKTSCAYEFFCLLLVLENYCCWKAYSIVELWWVESIWEYWSSLYVWDLKVNVYHALYRNSFLLLWCTLGSLSSTWYTFSPKSPHNFKCSLVSLFTKNNNKKTIKEFHFSKNEKLWGRGYHNPLPPKIKMF